MKDSKEISLYLDTATKALAVAMKCADKVKSYDLGNPKCALERTHLGIKLLCEDLACSMVDIDKYYCLLGPGSNTGIRLGLTIPRTIYALNPNIKLFGIPTMELLTMVAPVAALSDRNGNIFLAHKDEKGVTTYQRIDKKDIPSLKKEEAIVVEEKDTLANEELASQNLIKVSVIDLMMKYESAFKDFSNDEENYLPEYVLKI
ncbi:hypothetical protein DYE49_01900 [Treponema rectale]|uniref:Gcp-like domain-containing protein n=1 Tax=Treponema rectale TaxID=744512 RepID=A0A7M1XK85_9SPIR|nr:hypothetical protein DYE49_01900 [Treponema rectale]